jgi:hypothetical protein
MLLRPDNHFKQVKNYNRHRWRMKQGWQDTYELLTNIWVKREFLLLSFYQRIINYKFIHICREEYFDATSTLTPESVMSQSASDRSLNRQHILNEDEYTDALIL